LILIGKQPKAVKWGCQQNDGVRSALIGEENNTMDNQYIKNVSQVAGESEEITVQNMITEREKEIRQLTKELVWLKQYQNQMCV
jgi:Ni,Fe-hydrogenase III component G